MIHKDARNIFIICEVQISSNTLMAKGQSGCSARKLMIL